jgi:hypothetical protein
MLKAMLTIIALLALAAPAAASEVFLRETWDLHDSVSHTGVGLTLSSSTPGLYWHGIGEVGAIVASHTALDYRLEAAAGWMFGKPEAALTPYALIGYRQWAIYKQPRSAPETTYYGGGLRITTGSMFIAGSGNYYRDSEKWRPYAEIGSVVRQSLYGIYYEKSPFGADIVGIRYGYAY